MPHAKRTLALLALATSLPLCGTAVSGTLPADAGSGDGGVSAFYAWSDPIADRPVGNMLRTEPLPAARALDGASNSVGILYVSTDGLDGKTKVYVSGAVYFPKTQMPAGGWPIVAWAHGTTGIADVCAPSWRGRTKRDTAYLNTWLDNGYAVVATDYQGLGVPGTHPYLLVRPEAFSILDAVRAALSQWPGQLQNKVALIGQSQGSGAALGAAYYWPTYASDLKVVGVVATGIVGIVVHGTLSEQEELHPTNVEDPTHPPAAYQVMIFEGTWKAVVPKLSDEDYLKAEAMPLAVASQSQCLGDVFKLAAKDKITVDKVFERDTDPIARIALPYGEIPAGRFEVPIFTGTGLADNEVVPADQYRFLLAACTAGSPIQSHYYPGLTHNGAVNGSLKDSVPFILDVMSGRTPASNCSRLADPGPLQAPTPGIPGNN